MNLHPGLMPTVRIEFTYYLANNLAVSAKERCDGTVPGYQDAPEIGRRWPAQAGPRKGAWYEP
jgi:hypothetical protein